MKQLLQKSMATRLVGLVVAFFMMAAANGAAQGQLGGSDASGANSVSKTVRLPQSPVDLKQPSIVKKTGEPRPQFRNGEMVVKIGTDEYSDWETAVAALQENEEIVLLKDLELDATTATIPAVACTISGEQGTEVLSYKEVGECKTLLMKASLTFKNIILDMDGIMASGYPLVLDEGTDVSDAMKATPNSFRIWGGAFNKDVETTSITVKAGTYDYIYGGSSIYAVDGKATVDIQGGTINWVFGGGARAGSTVGETAVTFSEGTITQVICGGGASGDVENDTRLIIKGDASALIAHGGGYSGKVNGTSYTTIEESAAITGNFYGGGSEASAVCGNTEVLINGGTIGQVRDGYRFHLMGGGDEAPITGKAKVTINGGTFNCFITAGGGQYNDATTATCGSTELYITGGTFTKWTYGGGWSSPVLGTATVRVNGSANLSYTLCGGGARPTASCQNTDVQVSSGSLVNLYGGGEIGPVIGESKLTIDGSASASWTFGGCYEANCGSTNVTLNTTGTITGSLYGGCRTGSCNTTRVNIKQGAVTNLICGGGEQEASVVTGDTYVTIDGGSCIGVYGGGWQGQVNGTTHVLINGGTMSDAIYGGGFGDNQDSYTLNDKGRVGNTEVRITNVATKSTVFGGGLHGNVTGNTSVTIEGGIFQSVYGSSYIETGKPTLIGGNVSMLVKGGEIEFIQAARNQNPGEAMPVTGTMNITIEGGKITRHIGSGNHLAGNGYKPCTLTIRNQGSDADPYKLPETHAITNMVLDNSTVTYLEPEHFGAGINLNSIVVDENHPMIISGNGKLVGSKIILLNFESGSVLPADVPLLIGEELLVGASFVAYEQRGDGTVEGIATLPVYKVGNTYRKTSNEANLKIITITPSAHGKPSVVWKEPTRNTKLDSGDKVPADTELTLSLVPNAGYQGGTIYVDGQPLSGSTYTVTDDVTFSADGFIRIPDPDPTPTVYYNITIPTVEGVTTDPTPGNYEVEAWGSFRFFLTLDKEYDKSEPVVTTDRSETITPDSSNGAYIVKYVRSDVEIFIDGIVKNPDPVANTEIQSGTKAWVNDHRLFIRTDKPEDVLIYTFGGEQKKAFRSKGGDEVVSLEAGRYIVCVGDKRFKVIF